MVNQDFTVSDLFENQDNLISQRVVVNAVLILSGEECYLTQHFDLFDNTQQIKVHSPEIIEKLSSSVPCWVGGPATYYDSVKIIGVLQSGITQRNLLSISDISLLVLYRDEEIYEIEL